MMLTLIARTLLHLTGAFLLISCVFEATVVTSRAHDRSELTSLILSAVLMFICGIGFLLPHLTAKLVSSMALVSAAAWLFCTDIYRSQDWWIDCLFFLPLLLTLLLLHKQHDVPIRSLPHAN